MNNNTTNNNRNHNTDNHHNNNPRWAVGSPAARDLGFRVVML